MEDLPEELLSSIFSRLSIKDLSRSKATCKRWNALVSSPYFVEEYGARPKTRLDIILSLPTNTCSLYKVSPDSLLSGRPRLKRFSWMGKSFDFSGNHVVGCCNGIVCLHSLCTKDVLVWNPATREIWKLLNLIPCIMDPLKGPIPIFVVVICGFGYDPVSRDYKILTIQKPGKVRLHYLKSHSVKDLPLSFAWEKARCMESPRGVYLKGCLHWPLLNSDNSLLCFDLKDEIFQQTLLLPRRAASSTQLGVGVLEDCLCVYLPLSDNSCEVWVMKKYGVSSSWSKLLRRDNSTSPFPLTPLLTTPDRKVLFVEPFASFTIYNLSEGIMSPSMSYLEDLFPDEDEDQLPLCTSWVYKESPVSLRTLISAEDTSRTKRLSGGVDLPIFKRMPGPKIMLDCFYTLYALDCDSLLLKGQPEAHRFSPISNTYEFHEVSGSADKFSWMGKAYESNEVVGSCNGLVLLREREKPKLYLWNPTTRAVRKIRDTVHYLSSRSVVYGFGYDHWSDDYKIVKIHMCDLIPITAQLQCLKRNGWKNIPVPRRAGKMDYAHGVFLHGVLHWPALNANHSVMCFDLKDEIFSHTLLVPGMMPTTEKTISLAIGILGHRLSICIASGTENGHNYHCEVWMMKEYGVMSSWTMLFRTEGLKMPLKPFAAARNGEIMMNEGNDYFRVYDPNNGTLSQKKRYALKLSDCVPWAYEETLVSPYTLM